MSTTAPTRRFVRPRRNRTESGLIWLQMGLALFGGLALFLLVLSMMTLGYRLAYAGRIFPGVSVAGVDISGMKPVEAAVKLSGALTYPYSGRVVFRDGNKLWAETPARLGMVFDPGATAEAAFNLGRSGSLFTNLNDQLNAAQVGVDLPPINVFDQRIAYAHLQNLALEIDRPVIEASLNINGLDVSAQPGQVGRSLSVDSTLVYLNAQVQSFRDGEVPLVIIEQSPEVLDAAVQAEAARNLLSAPFSMSIPNAQAGDPGPWQIQPNELATMLRVGKVRAGNGSQYVIQLDRASLQPKLEEISKQVNRKAQNARFIFNDGTGQVEPIQASTIGLTMDVPGSLETVENAVAQGQQGVLLNVSANQPQVSDTANGAQLGVTQLISAQTTYFYGSTAARLQNIQAASAKFHGLLVPPGATFSMGEYMGDVSLDNGFAEAMIIYGGKTIKGVGGGVCQVSTTLFRTAFFAGFPIPERHAHAYRVYYYEQLKSGAKDPTLAGFDATVYFPLVDFKFTNDSPHWLLMETYFSPTSYSLTWKFYSTPDGRTVQWETTGPTNVVPAPKPVIQLNPEFSQDEIKHVDYAAEGADVTLNRTVLRDGKILFADKFFTQYQPWADVCEYGPGTKDPEKLFKKKGWCQG